MWLNTIYVGDGFHVPIYPTSGSGTGDPSRDGKPISGQETRPLQVCKLYKSGFTEKLYVIKQK